MCGGGALLLEAGRRAAGGALLAFDAAPAQAARAQAALRAAAAAPAAEQAARAAWGGASVLVADARALPLREASVDCVLVDLPFGDLHALPAPGRSRWCGGGEGPEDAMALAVLSEAARVTRAGGALCVLTVHAPALLEALCLPASWCPPPPRAAGAAGAACPGTPADASRAWEVRRRLGVTLGARRAEILLLERTAMRVLPGDPPGEGEGEAEAEVLPAVDATLQRLCT